MSDPHVYCTSCGARKNVMDHMRAENPVQAAKNAIKKWPRCKKTCDIHYLAGVDVEGFKRLFEELKRQQT